MGRLYWPQGPEEWMHEMRLLAKIAYTACALGMVAGLILVWG